MATLYVGKGSNGQVFSHRKYALRTIDNKGRKRLVYSMIHKFLRGDIEFIEEIMFDNLTESEAFAIEKEMIAKYGRIDLGTGCLANHTDGGEGCSGILCSDELRKLRRDRMIGIPKTEKHKQHMRENHADYSGENHPNYGKQWPEDVRKRMSEGMKGIKSPHSQKNIKRELVKG